MGNKRKFMKNVFDDEKKQKEKEVEEKRDAAEVEAVKAEKQKEKDLVKQREKDKLKAEARAEVELEMTEAMQKSNEERELIIKKIQNKKTKSAEEKEILKRLLVERAKINAKSAQDLGKLLPSQMSLIEMVQYCVDNKIPYNEGDNTIILRMRINAFRNPGRAERLRMLEERPNLGKIVR